MRQGNTGSFFGRFLLGAALLQSLLLLISIIAAFFSPAQYGSQSERAFDLIALLSLGILGFSFYRDRRLQEARFDAYRIAVPLGWLLGIVMIMLLHLSGFGGKLVWASVGVIWLITLLFTSPATLDSISALFALVSAGLYIVFAAVYVTCFLLVARRSGSVRQGVWSGVIAAMATFLGASLTFSLIDIVENFIFHARSGLLRLTIFPTFSPLLDYTVSYQSVVQLIYYWLFPPVLFGLLIVLFCSLFVRRAPRFRTSRQAS